jgi:hypothetical protein
MKFRSTLLKIAPLVLLLFAACKQPGGVPEARTDSGSARQGTDGASTAKPTNAVARSSEISLLKRTPVSLTLSSRVDNPRDFPEHLVDESPGTAWNGKTGDLNAWISVTLDPRVQVRAIAMTAGFDKGPLFEKNLRITKLRIEREGKELKVVTLDPSKREAQVIPINEPGGNYKLTVVETQQGSTATWKEVVVSELTFLGDAPMDLVHAKPRFPEITIAPGSAPAPKPRNGETKVTGLAAADLRALCAVWSASAKAKAQDAIDYEVLHSGGTAKQYSHWLSVISCKPEGLVPIEGDLPQGFSNLGSIRTVEFVQTANFNEKRLVLKDPDGKAIIGPRLTMNGDADLAPSIAFKVTCTHVGTHDVLAASEVRESWTGSFKPKTSTMGVEFSAITCLFDTSRIDCDEAGQTYAGEAMKRGSSVIWPKLNLSPKTGRLEESP